MEELLKADIEEALLNHYGYTPKEVRQFLYLNLEQLLDEAYQAQSDQLLNAINKFNGATS